MKNSARRLLGASVALACLAGSGEAFSQQQLGVNYHNPQVAQTETSAVQVGLTLRADMQWRWIEKSQGNLSFGDYTKSDALVKEAVQKGLKPIVVLCCAPTAFYDGDLPKSNDAIQAYVRYVKFVVDHYKGTVNQFEVWNEWNLNTGSKLPSKVWGDAGDYARLVKAAAPAIKSVNPQAVVIGGVVGGTDGRWIEKFIKAGGLDGLDGFSTHPYVQRHAHNHPDKRDFDAAPASGDPLALTSHVLGTPEESIAFIDQLHNRLSKAGSGRTLPIYVSEMGWPTSTSEFGVSEAAQAAYLQRFLLMAATRPWIAGVWWYDLVDDGANAGDDEHRFGLLHQSGEPKPAYGALMDIKDVITNNSGLKQSAGPNGEVVISGTYAGSKQIYAAWMPTDDLNAKQHSADVDSRVKSGFAPLSARSASNTLSGTPLILTK